MAQSASGRSESFRRRRSFAACFCSAGVRLLFSTISITRSRERRLILWRAALGERDARLLPCPGRVIKVSCASAA